MKMDKLKKTIFLTSKFLFKISAETYAKNCAYNIIDKIKNYG